MLLHKALPESGRTEDDNVSRHAEIKVAVLASRALTRVALRTVMAESAGVEIVAEATTPFQLNRVVAAERPQALLLDDADPAWDTTEVLRGLRENTERRVGVVILADAGALDDALTYLCEGADGVVLNDDAPTEVATAVRAVAEGHAVVPPPLARRLVDLVGVRGPAMPARDRLAALTAREQEIFELVIKGMSNQEVAETLVLSERTIKFHVSNLLRKLGVRNRTQAIVYARDRRLLQGTAPCVSQ
ncbi:response regulator transcription factor [Streptomyces sp. IMTB 2501]|uniref:LuxR C-terminal-related transcriptional regulator n=1 Tax=Streptomyces sp. IMTB 2501 TaxID=1776340 RepID=UPI0009A21A27|nr:response regulator transcription factor [Streptomyces sp. IMTB 2501]